MPAADVRLDPQKFLHVWTDQNVKCHQRSSHLADALTKKFLEDASAHGFVLAQFMFNEASLARYITEAMVAQRD
jgi:hypothetical protein